MLGRLTGRDAQADAFIAFRRAHLDAIAERGSRRRRRAAAAGLSRGARRHLRRTAAIRRARATSATTSTFVGGHNIGADVLPGASGRLNVEYVVSRRIRTSTSRPAGRISRSPAGSSSARATRSERARASLAKMTQRPGIAHAAGGQDRPRARAVAPAAELAARHPGRRSAGAVDSSRAVRRDRSRPRRWRRSTRKFLAVPLEGTSGSICDNRSSSTRRRRTRSDDIQSVQFGRSMTAVARLMCRWRRSPRSGRRPLGGTSRRRAATQAGGRQVGQGRRRRLRDRRQREHRHRLRRQRRRPRRAAAGADRTRSIADDARRSRTIDVAARRPTASASTTRRRCSTRPTPATGSVSAIDLKTGQGRRDRSSDADPQGAHLREVARRRRHQTGLRLERGKTGKHLGDRRQDQHARARSSRTSATHDRHGARRRRTLYAANLSANEIAVIDLKTRAGRRRAFRPAASARPTRRSMPKTKRLFVTNQAHRRRHACSTHATGKVLATVKTGAGALGIGFNPADQPGLRRQPRRRHGDGRSMPQSYEVVANLPAGIAAQHGRDRPQDQRGLRHQQGQAGRRGAPPVDDPSGDTVTMIKY